MATTPSPKSVTLPLAGTTAVVIGSDLADGKLPSAKSLVGLAFVWTALGFLSDAQPSIGVPFAWLTFVGSLMVKGENVSTAIANRGDIDLGSLKPFQVIKDVAVAATGGVGETVGKGVTDVIPSVKGALGDISKGSKAMMKGGVGGNWGGSGPIAETIGAVSGLPVTSRKRSTQMTASGNTSDHYVGSTNAYAVDLGVSSLAQGDAALAKIMGVLGRPEYKGGSWLNLPYGQYRIQVGWRVPGHYDHIHVGVRRV